MATRQTGLGLVVAVEVRSVYGADKIYPANQAANVFTALTGKKTFDLTDLRNIQRLGFDIAEVHQRRINL